MTRLLLAAATALASLVWVAPPAYSCSCARMTLEQRVERVDHVFVATVRQPAGTDERVVRMALAVDRVFKGGLPAQVDLATSASQAACGLGRLPHGVPMLFFAHAEETRSQDRPTQLFGGLCDGTDPATADHVAEVTALLGEPSPPAPAPAPTPAAPAAHGGPGPDQPAVPTAGDGVPADPRTPLWPWLLGLVALATGAATYVARRTS